MNSALLFAYRALDDLAHARNQMDGLLGRSDKTADEAVRRWSEARRVAVQAIREAVPGPDSPGEWGRLHRGNRALVPPGSNQMFVLVESDFESDFESDINETAIVVVALPAIAGLPVNG
jgi:hypothetical protein